MMTDALQREEDAIISRTVRRGTPYADKCAFTAAVRKAFKADGHRVFTPRKLASGDCAHCGEAGRCPGVHIHPETTAL